MITITNYLERQRNDGSSFIVLEITGGVELVQSSNTGNFYATVRKCTIPSTFSADIAEKLIGSQLPGQIVRVNVDPYEYVNQRTGEVMQLQHSYAYRPEGSMELIGVGQVEMA
jgi:hypothetical protein